MGWYSGKTVKYNEILTAAVLLLRCTDATITDEANDLLLFELKTVSNMVGLSMMNILIDKIPASD